MANDWMVVVFGIGLTALFGLGYAMVLGCGKVWRWWSTNHTDKALITRDLVHLTHIH